MIESKNLAIIGGSGFIGTRLVSRLKGRNYYSTTILDKVPSPSFPDIWKQCDVRSISQLRDTLKHSATIVHLAAEHRDDVRPVSLYDDVNVGGAKNIVAIAREKEVKKIVFTSSVAVYGFAPIGTDESGEIAPFNDYGRTKYEAEAVFKAWQAELPSERTLVIVRPTVVFGEQNRGNVYNLLRQIASGRFVMVGGGENRKSMAYVENIAAFVEYSISFQPGIHIYNYIDKPDFTMNSLVNIVNRILGRTEKLGVRLPYIIGCFIGKGFDFAAYITGKKYTISSIRVKKFCSNSVYNTGLSKTGFVAPVSLLDALEQTTRHEFVESHDDKPLYFTE